MANQTWVSVFVLVGFPGLPEKFHATASLAFFLIYNMALLSNIIVLGLIILKEHLHQPMYLIICNLALSDLLLDTVTLPKIIAKYWFGDGSLRFAACFFQMFFVHNLGTLDSFIILLMAADRFVAICKPLHYCSIITNKVVSISCVMFWSVAGIIGLAIAIMGAQLPYCGPNKVKNCFCSLTPVSVLSCADSLMTRRAVFIIALVVHLVPLSFIIFSYVIIIRKIHLMSRSDNLQKLYYTCTTHWFVIFFYFIPRLTVYTYNQVQLFPNADLNVLLICLYTFLPHFTSPIIFCLRTEEIKNTLRHLFRKIIKFVIAAPIYDSRERFQPPGTLNEYHNHYKYGISFLITAEFGFCRVGRNCSAGKSPTKQQRQENPPIHNQRGHAYIRDKMNQVWIPQDLVVPAHDQKAYYTCITHLLVIALYYVPRVFLYIAKLIGLVLNADVNILLLCLYTFVSHVANPIIYCLMTKEIKQTLAVILNRHFRACDSLDGPLAD
ncbi:olfactory receptor 52K1-like [Gastrophryne carolinensis]